ncbi:CAP Gly-rich domain-containing protein [Catenaria anguillulae PL171]|uniref:CAP Gly-rich domain-containing protein n=1 Tax=Catenaria anguillulae PL171 TaxID=765915 RepID=A0A1Y2I6A1_9FUNG|nr:CAP Gly-rich domain-containing protein [Catenaria anguillulae PL171]
MIEWWHSSPFTTKLQYVFSFIDVDGDEFITMDDLLVVIPRLLGSRPQIGDKVHLKSSGFAGTIRYVGPVPEKGKGDFVGIELTSPVGSSNGTLKGQSYFKCLPMHGVFVNPDQCELPVSNQTQLHSVYPGFNFRKRPSTTRTSCSGS